MSDAKGTGDLCLQTIGVSKSYGGVDALRSVDLEVAHGARHGLIGPNGAGKSTLLAILSGVDRPSSGQVLFRGRDITRMPSHRRTALGIGCTFQVTSLFPDLTVRENLILAVQALWRVKLRPFGSALKIQGVAERAEHVAGRIGLSDRLEIPVGSLSYGEQRQLEIGMSLANDPALVLMDEPTAGLSQAEVVLVVDLLKRLPSEITVVFIEHDMVVAFDIAEKITVLSEGSVVAEGAPKEIRANRTVRDIYLGEVEHAKG